jgi:hypothetical protein
MSPDPLWRITLYWGTVISFFTLPLVVFVIHLSAIIWPEAFMGNAKGHGSEFKYVFEFHRTLAALVFGLAGLHTGQVIAGNQALAKQKRTLKNEPP